VARESSFRQCDIELNRNEFVAVCSKYSRDVDRMTPMQIKDMIWDNFARTVLL